MSTPGGVVDAVDKCGAAAIQQCRRTNSIAGDEMADQAPEFDGRTRADLPPGVFGMMAVLVTATVIAILYFAREVFVPITLAVLLSFLLAPAVRWLRRLRVGRVIAVGLTVLLAFIAIAGFAAVVVGGGIVAGAPTPGIQIQSPNQNPLASGNSSRGRGFQPSDEHAP